MHPDTAVHMLSDMLWMALLIAGPLLLLTLAIGVVVSVFQVITQVQEASLTFVPKLLCAVAVLVLCGPWMLRKLVAYSTTLVSNIPSYF